jgi:hypothetical protein
VVVDASQTEESITQFIADSIVTDLKELGIL